MSWIYFYSAIEGGAVLSGYWLSKDYFVDNFKEVFSRGAFGFVCKDEM